MAWHITCSWPAKSKSNFRHNSMLIIRSAIRSALHARCGSMTTVASFHTSMVQSFPRHTRDMNSDRGISPLHRRPQKEPLGAEKHGIPQPVLDPARRTKIETDPDHGLWGFFQEQKALPTPEEDHKHGRAWTVEELRQKSWDDLHKLWWKCVRERNIIETQAQERKRLQPGYGDFEANDRKRQVKWTQRAIKHALTERYYAWQEAQELAKIDPEVDLSGNGPAYNPLSLEEEEPTVSAANLATTATTTTIAPEKQA